MRCPPQPTVYTGNTRDPVWMYSNGEKGDCYETYSNTTYCKVNSYEGLIYSKSYHNGYINHNHYVFNAMLNQANDAFMFFNNLENIYIDSCNFIDNDSKDKNGGFKSDAGSTGQSDVYIDQCYFYKHQCQYMFWTKEGSGALSYITITNTYGSESPCTLR